MSQVRTSKISTIYRVNKHWNHETTEGKSERERQGKEREKEGVHGEQREGIYHRWVVKPILAIIIIIDYQCVSPALHWSRLPPGHCVSLRGHQTQASDGVRGRS